MEIVGEVLGDLPLIQADMTVFSEEPIEMPSNIVVENKKATAESNTIIYIGANLLRRPEVSSRNFIKFGKKKMQN